MRDSNRLLGLDDSIQIGLNRVTQSEDSIQFNVRYNKPCNPHLYGTIRKTAISRFENILKASDRCTEFMYNYVVARKKLIVTRDRRMHRSVAVLYQEED